MSTLRFPAKIFLFRSFPASEDAQWDDFPYEFMGAEAPDDEWSLTEKKGLPHHAWIEHVVHMVGLEAPLGEEDYPRVGKETAPFIVLDIEFVCTSSRSWEGEYDAEEDFELKAIRSLPATSCVRCNGCGQLFENQPIPACPTCRENAFMTFDPARKDVLPDPTVEPDLSPSDPYHDLFLDPKHT
jgi:rubrerythrin